MIFAHRSVTIKRNRIPRKLKKHLKKDVVGCMFRKYGKSFSKFNKPMIKISVNAEAFNQSLRRTQVLLYQLQTELLN